MNTESAKTPTNVAARLETIRQRSQLIIYEGTDHSEDDRRLLPQNEPNLFFASDVDESVTYRRRINAAHADIKRLGHDVEYSRASSATERIAAFNLHGVSVTWKGDAPVVPLEPDQLEGAEASAFNTPEKRLLELSLDPLYTEKVASNAGASAALLDQLANSDDVFVRAHVADNKSTSIPTLERLALERGSGVLQRRLAGNPNTPHEILRDLASRFEDGSMGQEELARNPSAPSDALDEIARTGSWIARKRVAENKATTPATAAYLLRDSFRETRTAVWVRKDFHKIGSVALATDSDGTFDQTKYETYSAMPEEAVRLAARHILEAK